jgi:hypothetical protein
MKIKHKDIVIDPQSPFANCKLDREKYASILTEIVTTYNDGFVLAINNEWGTGKTTFVKMWQQQLQNKGYRTLYFNAWETDFEDNPLIAMIAEFEMLANKKDKRKYKSVIQKGAVFAKNAGPQLLKSLAENYGAAKAVVETIEAVSKGGTEILVDEIKSYNKKKKGIKDFKNSLESFLHSVEATKPIVFIIDELDRCRPSYSVSLLEQVKHLFSVPGIVFVLSIDKEQLGNAVRGVYGSDLINANEYLRRFIDLEYSIPHPDVKAFVVYLYHYFSFNEILLSEQRKKIQEFYHEPDAIIDLATLLFDKAHLSLRQQEKIFAHARVALRSLQWNQFLFPTLFLFLIYLKNHHSSLYGKIERKNLNPQELLDEVYNLFPKGVGQDNIRHVIQLEALLATLYNNYVYERGYFTPLIEANKSEEAQDAKIKSRFDTTEGQSEFKKFLKSAYNRDYMQLSVKYILDRINLIKTISV